MTVYVFGSLEVAADSLPPRILDELRRQLPETVFVHKDPNENWELEPNAVILDTVVGLKEPAVFRGLDEFASAPRLTMHDFDLYAELRLRQKIGLLPKLSIIALPPQLAEPEAILAVKRLLKELT